MDIEEIKNVPAAYQAMIREFCAQHSGAKMFLEKNDIESANQAYLKMAEVYTKISNAPNENIHKNIAHQALTSTYEQIHSLNEPLLSNKSMRLMAATSFIILIAIAAIMLKPSIVGLAAADLDTGPKWIGPASVTIQGTTTINLNKQFTGADTYLATNGDPIRSSVIGEFLTITPEYGYKGKDGISIIAADSKEPSKNTKINLQVAIDPLKNTQ